jgi:hypothetical protein
MVLIIADLQPKETINGKQRWKILVVEDDSDTSKLIKLLLEIDGHAVQTAIRRHASVGGSVSGTTAAVPLTEAQRDCVFFFVPRRARVKPQRNVRWSRQCSRCLI